MTKLPAEKKALAIFLPLRGIAKKAALQLETKDLKVNKGVVKFSDSVKYNKRGRAWNKRSAFCLFSSQ